MLPSVTWIGHATALVQLGGITLLTDPVFSERASPVSFAGPRRHVAPGIAVHELPHVDLVLVSHNHYDHLDGASIDALVQQSGGAPTFVVPLGLKSWFESRGLSTVVELDWWQTFTLGAIDILLCPAQHWSGRGLADRMKTLWGGFAVLAARQRPVDGGGFDLALLPIGAYEPRWFMANQHVNPAEAVKIHRNIGAKASLGVHWGTFELTDEALDEPPQSLKREAASAGLVDEEFFVLAVGETRLISQRASSAPAAD